LSDADGRLIEHGAEGFFAGPECLIDALHRDMATPPRCMG
jgi:hypothetical protein